MPSPMQTTTGLAGDIVLTAWNFVTLRQLHFREFPMSEKLFSDMGMDKPAHHANLRRMAVIYRII
jgi:hypothetical protein